MGRDVNSSTPPLPGSPSGTFPPSSRLDSHLLAHRGSLISTSTDDQSRNTSSCPAPGSTASDSLPPTSTIGNTASTASERPMLLRSSSFNSSASFSLEPAGSGSGTASTSAQSDKRAGPAAAGSSTLSVISSSSAYRPIHLSLDQARSFKQTIPTLLSPNRAYHDDQAYIGLPSPLSPSSSNESVPDLHCRGRYLLPCPPTSPSGRRVRFGLNECQSDLRRALGWVRDRVFPTPRQMAYSTGKEHRPNLHTPSKSAQSGQNMRSPNPAFWIVLYFTLNLSLTLYNKYVLIHFPFPYTLTALHALCGTVGTCIMLHLVGMGKPSASPGEKELTTKSSVSPIPNLTLKETVVVLLFSMLYTVNIVVSNASLKLVTVPVSAYPLLVCSSRLLPSISSTKWSGVRRRCSRSPYPLFSSINAAVEPSLSP